jgi:hypothetical protein
MSSPEYQEKLKRYVTANYNEVPDRIPMRLFAKGTACPPQKRPAGTCIPWEEKRQGFPPFTRHINPVGEAVTW